MSRLGTASLTSLSLDGQLKHAWQQNAETGQLANVRPFFASKRVFKNSLPYDMNVLDFYGLLPRAVPERFLWRLLLLTGSAHPGFYHAPRQEHLPDPQFSLRG